jgi:hypothetical protein
MLQGVAPHMNIDWQEPTQITAPSEYTSQVHSWIPNKLQSVNKPTVTNVYVRAGTEGNRLDDTCKDPHFHYIFRVVL